MEREGVIKYQLDYTRAVVAPGDTAMLESWRTRLCAEALLGQIPGRYGGLGFGNLSIRRAAGFLITGSQTSGLGTMTPADYALVSRWDLGANQVVASGLTAPSSEALTHAALYDLSPAVNVVFHVHSPLIWRHCDALGLAQTLAQIPYGTPAMAQEVARLMTGAALPAVFSMMGHEDGIVAYGEDCQSTGELLVKILADAAALSR
jgi:ribulose-5-phosphate 4-epimerase/fuculose-1-phosphate aldolase